MTEILEQLASGRIDASEAARQIDALRQERQQAAPSESAPSTHRSETEDSAGPAIDTAAEPVTEDQVDAAGESDTDAADPNAWAAATDRPQQPGAAAHESAAPHSAPRRPTIQVKPTQTQGVERLSVRAVGRRVRIVGEPSVATVSADGPHVLRRNGSVLEISSDGEIGASLDGFQLLRNAPRSLDDFRSLGLGKELFLRVNPALVIDVELTAGSLNTEGVPRLGKVRVTAGGARMVDVEQVDDVLVQAGQATLKGTITSGRSRVRAESGSLVIALGDESDVTVHSEAQLGKVSWAGGHTGSGDEVIMGQGSARLDVEVVMGHAQVRIGSDAAEYSA